MTYFKHTSGEAFTLEGSDYIGFFHINELGIAYSGKTLTDTSLLLTPKTTFLANVFERKLHFNSAYKNINQLNEYYSNVLDNLNYEGLQSLSDIVNQNNLIAFKGLVVDNPQIYNFEAYRNQFYSFPLSANVDSLDLLPQTTPLSYNTFKNNNNWNFLDDVISGEVIIDNNDNFKYICSTGLVNYVLSGSFSKQIPLTILSENNQFSLNPADLNYTYHIGYDEPNNRILYVTKDHIDIYDSTNFSDCNSMFLIDKINLKNKTTTDVFVWNTTSYQFSKHKRKWNSKFHIDNANNPEFIKFGNNLRTSIHDNVLYLNNKYSSDEIYKINLKLFEIGEVLSIDIRGEDDHVIILNKKQDGLYVIHIDILNIANSSNVKIESAQLNKPWYTIKFSKIDSDLYYLSNESEYQTRHISYHTYPTGRINSENLQYASRYKWNETFERYNIISTTWNAGKMLSNYYNNILSTEQTKNNKMYLLLHNKGRIYILSQPINERYYNNVDLNLPKYFNTITCSETSIGIHFNTILLNIIKDALNLYNKSYGNYTIEEFGILDNVISDLILDTHNFYINGNETFNILVFRRILSELYNIQSKLISNT